MRKRENIRNGYNQAPHLTQDTNGKVTTSQLDITHESQEVSPFPAGDHNAPINRRARKHNKNQTEITYSIHKKHLLGTVSKNILLQGLNLKPLLRCHFVFMHTCTCYVFMVPHTTIFLINVPIDIGMIVLSFNWYNGYSIFIGNI